MSDEPLTWDNIPGLTDEERRAGRALMNIDDLRSITLENAEANGVKLPPIVNGVGIR